MLGGHGVCGRIHIKCVTGQTVMYWQRWSVNLSENADEDLMGYSLLKVLYFLLNWWNRPLKYAAACCFAVC